MAQAVWAIAGNFHIDDGIGPQGFDGLDRQPGVGESVGGGLSTGEAGQKIAEPCQTDLHAALFLMPGTHMST